MSAIRILLIEDDPDISDLLQAALEPTYECLRATNGLEGLQLAEAGEPDLIISDIMMPVMDGYEFIRRLRKDSRFASIPVVFLSALGTREKIREGYDLGAALYLTKPIDPTRMRRNVELFIEDHGVAPRPKLRPVKDVQAEIAPPGAAEPVEKAPSSAAAPEAARSGAVAMGPAVENQPARKPAASGRVRVMVVEDDTEGVELLREEFAKDFEFVQAFDGMEAMERAVRYEPDIFIIDGMLPKMTGFQLVSMLRRNKAFCNHPIVLVSAKTSNRDRHYVEKLGVKYFLPKPFDVKDLRKTVDEIAAASDFVIAEKKVNDKQMNLETLRDFETRR